MIVQLAAILPISFRPFSFASLSFGRFSFLLVLRVIIHLPCCRLQVLFTSVLHLMSGKPSDRRSRSKYRDHCDYSQYYILSCNHSSNHINRHIAVPDQPASHNCSRHTGINCRNNCRSILP